MNSKTLKSIIFIALLVHGIGHIQGVVCGFGVKFRDSSTYLSWLLKGMGDTPNRILCILFFLSTAVLSTAGLILFPRALAMFFNLAGAILVNVFLYWYVITDPDL